MVIFEGSPSDDHGDVLHVFVSDDDRGFSQLEEREYLSPGFQEYIQKEDLKLSRYRSGGRLSWVFWSERDNESELTLPLDNRDPIRHAIGNFMLKQEPYGLLVQFWAPTKTMEGRTLLTTQFQPFALSKIDEKNIFNNLCQYRMGMCREYNKSFYADAECVEEQLGLLGRVFLHQFPEFTSDLTNYSKKEYPQRDLALKCELSESWVLPVFEHSSHTCIGVLEIVSCSCPHPFLDESIFGHVYDSFQEFGLHCADKHYQMQIENINEACTSAYQELEMVLEMVSNIHEVPLIMAWASCSACNDLLPLVFLSEDENNALAASIAGNKFSHLRMGGLAGMVLSPPYMLYCSDITKLSVSEYPLVPYARKCEFRGWFTVCLQSSYTATDIYVLEFFLPKSNRCRDHLILSLIVGTMEENFRTFKLISRLKWGYLHSLEVMDFQNGRKLRPIQKIQAKDGRLRAMLQLGQLDQPPMDAINNGADVVSEAQIHNLRSFQPLQNGKVTTLLDSYDRPSMDPSSNGQNVVTAERNSHVVSSSKDHKRKMQVREYKTTGVPITIPFDEILKCSSMNRDAAAKQLKVSQSTFKHVCKKYGIDQWPSRYSEKVQPSPSESRGRTPQIDSDLPPNDDSASVLSNTTGFQETDLMTVWAKFKDYKIKIRLSLSSKLEELQKEIAKRLSLRAETYCIMYKDVEDEEDGLTLIACDEDLQDCMHTSRSAGRNSVVVLLELNETLTNLSSGLPQAQQTLISPFLGQGLQNVEAEPSIVPIMHSRGGDWLEAHFSFIPTIEVVETINRCMEDGHYWGEFVDGC